MEFTSKDLWGLVFVPLSGQSQQVVVQKTLITHVLFTGFSLGPQQNGGVEANGDGH